MSPTEIGVVSCSKKDANTAGQSEKTTKASKSEKSAKYATGLELVNVTGGEFETPI